MAKILVVDDLEVIVVMMSPCSRPGAGAALRAPRNGQEALAVAQSFVPEIMFMDLDMPVMRGIEAARLLKSELPFQPCFVAIAAAATGAIAGATGQAGFDLCMRKFADTAAMLRRIAAARTT